MRLMIEKFSDKVTKALYSSRRDPVGIASDDERANITALLVRDLDELQENMGMNVSRMFFYLSRPAYSADESLHARSQIIVGLNATHTDKQ